LCVFAFPRVEGCSFFFGSLAGLTGGSASGNQWNESREKDCFMVTGFHDFPPTKNRLYAVAEQLD
jgi:hypothetical protein